MKNVILIRDPENDEETKLLSKFNEASRRVNDSKAGMGGSEAYAIAYQQLVKAGLAQQIKRKYRG